MQLKQETFSLQTPGRKIIEITKQISHIATQNPVEQGLCHIFLAHTSASLIFCENFDADVRFDLEKFMSRLVPDGDPHFQHVAEGADDMPAHVRTVLTQNSLLVPVSKGKLQLGSWQGVFLCEHRMAPHKRNITVTIFGNN